jgi:hypothetical protein
MRSVVALGAAMAIAAVVSAPLNAADLGPAYPGVVGPPQYSVAPPVAPPQVTVIPGPVAPPQYGIAPPVAVGPPPVGVAPGPYPVPPPAACAPVWRCEYRGCGWRPGCAPRPEPYSDPYGPPGPDVYSGQYAPPGPYGEPAPDIYSGQYAPPGPQVYSGPARPDAGYQTYGGSYYRQ